jgi:hypothetical protein
VKHFLIVYDLQESQTVRIDEFGSDSRRATGAYAEAEEAYRDRGDSDRFEIVLVGADSLDTIRVTHSRYFDSAQTHQELPF